ncbi:MAG: type II toxin-antitoxin system HicB family antitoxin [Bacteroidales bacterium]|nr:type II toxin-antitoxin system HicB family antitoxin [Bacteroidales bacterium]
MGNLNYKGYSGTVEYDETDNRLVGKVLGLKQSLILYEGDTLENLRKDFEDAVEDYLETCKAEGIAPEKPYSGRTVVRMSSQLHQEAAAKARSIGISLNEFITRAISAAVL